MTTDVLGKREFYEADGACVSALIDPRPRPELEDVQNHADHRQVPIEQVGVSDLRYPITVLDRAAESQRTVATITLSLGLPQDTKGTHMSRFLHVLERQRGEITVRTLPVVPRDLKATLEAESARIEARFPSFLERRAPVGGVPALVDYQCAFVGEMNGGEMDFVLDVHVPVTSLCPCSKAISDYGAHNQRGFVRIETRSTEIVWIDELIEVAEASASTPVYALLKRADERFLPMRAYENPVFVEDMVRNAAVHLREDARVTWFRVRAENHESIHNHNAFAQVSFSRRKA